MPDRPANRPLRAEMAELALLPGWGGTPVARGLVLAAVAGTLARTLAATALVAIGDEATVASLRDGARTPPSGFDEWRGGLGLSLPVGRRVIERQGGTLWSAGGEQPRSGSALRLPLRT